MKMESELTQANVSEQNTLSASNKVSCNILFYCTMYLIIFYVFSYNIILFQIKLPKTGPLDKIFSKFLNNFTF